MMKKMYGVKIALSWSLILFILQLTDVSEDNTYFYLIIALLSSCVANCVLYYSSDLLSITSESAKRTVWARALSFTDACADGMLFLCFAILVLLRTDNQHLWGILWFLIPAFVFFTIDALTDHIIRHLKAESVAELENICKDSEPTPENIKRISSIYESINAKSALIENYIKSSESLPSTKNVHELPTQANIDV